MIYVEKEKKKKRSYAEKIVERKVIKHIQEFIREG